MLAPFVAVRDELSSSAARRSRNRSAYEIAIVRNTGTARAKTSNVSRPERLRGSRGRQGTDYILRGAAA